MTKSMILMGLAKLSAAPALAQQARTSDPSVS